MTHLSKVLNKSFGEISRLILWAYGILGALDFVFARFASQAIDEKIPRFGYLFYIIPWYWWVMIGLCLFIFGLFNHSIKLSLKIEMLLRENTPKAKFLHFLESYIDCINKLKKKVDLTRDDVTKIMQPLVSGIHQAVGIKIADEMIDIALDVKDNSRMECIKYLETIKMFLSNLQERINNLMLEQKFDPGKLEVAKSK